ncbi:MAG: hypothetical protein QM755_15165 [Luteolibacter sp.]
MSHAGQAERFLVQGQGRDRIDPPGQGQVDGFQEELVRSGTRPRIDATGKNVGQ